MAKAANNYQILQSELRNKVCQDSKDQEMIGLQDEQQKLKELLRQSILFRESNSVLIVGPASSGKTMLVRTVIDQIKHIKDISNNMVQVDLNGLIHSDDRQALIDISQQLGLGDIRDKPQRSSTEMLTFLLEKFRSGDHGNCAIIITLEEFDLFTQHRNQALLYDLFDASQSTQTTVIVIGITRRLDVVELLEKRVKSRFSHRQIHLLNTQSYEDYVQIFKSLLAIEDKRYSAAFSKSWNDHVKDLADNDIVKDVLRKIFDYNKDLRLLKSLLIMPVCQIYQEHPQITPDDLIKSCKHLTMDYKVAMIEGLSVLELCLLIAMKHLSEKRPSGTFNFEMLYQEYMQFIITKSHSVEKHPRPVVFKAYERLLDMELIRPVGNINQKVLKEFWQMSLEVQATQIADALQKYTNCPTSVMQWALNPIHT